MPALDLRLLKSTLHMYTVPIHYSLGGLLGILLPLSLIWSDTSLSTAALVLWQYHVGADI